MAAKLGLTQEVHNKILKLQVIYQIFPKKISKTHWLLELVSVACGEEQITFYCAFFTTHLNYILLKRRGRRWRGGENNIAKMTCWLRRTQSEHREDKKS